MNVVRKSSLGMDNINNSNFQEQDPMCVTHEDIEKTINIFLSAVENLMNRNNGKYKELTLNREKTSLIRKVENSKKPHKSSTLKKVAYSMVGHTHEDVPTLDECLAEETELKLIQYRRTQEEQRAIEKSAIKAKYLAEHLDIPVNNLKYMKHLFYDLTRKWVATRYAKFSKLLAAQSENIDKEWVVIRETELKQIDIDSKIEKILKEEGNILEQIWVEYPFYIKAMYQKYPQIFDRKPTISFYDLFADKKSIPYTLTVRVEVPIKEKNPDENNPKVKIEYKAVRVNVKLRETVRMKFINKSTILDRRVLNDFITKQIDTSDLFWMLHIAIDKVIQQEQNKMQQEQREKWELKKKR